MKKRPQPFLQRSLDVATKGCTVWLTDIYSWFICGCRPVLGFGVSTGERDFVVCTLYLRKIMYGEIILNLNLTELLAGHTKFQTA